MVQPSNPSRSPSPKPNSNRSSAIVAGRFIVSDATSEETAAASLSPSKSVTSCCNRRVLGRFTVADEDAALPYQYNQPSRFEILDLPVVHEGCESTDEPLSLLLRNLSDRVLVVERENDRLKADNASLRAELARMQSQPGGATSVVKDLSEIFLFS